MRSGDVRRIPVDGGIHGDALDAELSAGVDDTEGNLAAVGDQELLDHGRLS
jgi:hypothetical protein